ncbi:guanylate kinase [bacterium]|nr:guanylate kinase [bacterium]
MTHAGLVVVISSPSGGGKSTIIENLLATGNNSYHYSISATTRSRRSNEKDGRDYYFLDYDDFIRKQKNGEFVEWAEVHGDLYATPRASVDGWLQQGLVVLLDVDVDGGLEIKERYGPHALLIFIKPPSFESLLQRLKERNTESDSQIERRLSRYPKEIMKSKLYDHIVVNENLDKTIQSIAKIITEHHKAEINRR